MQAREKQRGKKPASQQEDGCSFEIVLNNAKRKAEESSPEVHLLEERHTFRLSLDRLVVAHDFTCTSDTNPSVLLETPQHDPKYPSQLLQCRRAAAPEGSARVCLDKKHLPYR